MRLLVAAIIVVVILVVFTQLTHPMNAAQRDPVPKGLR